MSQIIESFRDKPVVFADKTAERTATLTEDIMFIAQGLTSIACTILITYVGYKAVVVLVDMVDSQKSSGMSALNLKKSLAKRLNRPEVENMEFSKHEEKIMLDVIGADEINVSFADIGGMDKELEEVKDNIVLPFQIYKFYKNLESISTCPTGVLLYGAPGTGKSLTAKAIAKEAGATFISIKASTIMNKWFGETDKLVSALFSLGRKLAPSIIFIDEIETLLKKRDGGNGNQALHSMQGVFLSEWDGLTASADLSSADSSNTTQQVTTGLHQGSEKRTAGPTSNPPVVVLGATNRPMDLDKAFLRRMPVQIQTYVPDVKARVAILAAQLNKETLDEDVDLQELAMRTEQFTGSDIRELVRIASLQRVKSYVLTARESMRLISDANEKLNNNSSNTNNSGNNSGDSSSSAGASSVAVSGLTPGAKGTNTATLLQHANIPQRALNREDFEYALSKTAASVTKTRDYGKELDTAEMKEKVQRQVDAYNQAVGSMTATLG